MLVRKKVERTVLIADDGAEYELMERPGGVGTLEDYDRKLKDARRQFPHLFARLPSTEEYIRERREEAALEWKE